MFVGQKSVCFALPNGCTGPGPDFVSREGQYRVAVVVDTTTGFVGSVTATYTLRVAALADDIGVQPFYTGVPRHLPDPTPKPYPTGPGNTWCESEVVAGKYIAP